MTTGCSLENNFRAASASSLTLNFSEGSTHEYHRENMFPKYKKWIYAKHKQLHFREEFLNDP